jgi:N-acetylmuramoyl-L-alanine amidase
MKIAQAEAGNQGTEGMILIMAVVLNRVQDEDWPDSIERVIYQDHQFYTDGMDTAISAEAHEALAYVESGQPLDTEIIGFEVSTSTKLERYFEYAYTVGDHNFYRKGGN